jgi:hypothetical protein
MSKASSKHVSHTLLPARANVPRAHGVHAAHCTLAQKVLAGHVVQAPFSPEVPAGHACVGHDEGLDVSNGCMTVPGM